MHIVSLTEITKDSGTIYPLVTKLTKPWITCMNPSILIMDEILVNIRLTNYYLWNSDKYLHDEGPVSYCHGDNDRKLRSSNLLQRYDKNLNLIEEISLEFNDSQEKSEFIGIDDVRLVDWDGLKLIGSRRDDNVDKRSRMHIIHLDSNFKKLKSTRLEVPELTYQEKNWVPILDKPFHLVRFFNPLTIVKYLGPYESRNSNINSNLPNFRGSSQLVPIDDYYLAIVHTTEVHKPVFGRVNGIYLHYFIKISRDFNIIELSKPFKFMNENNSIEFCNGLAYLDGYLYVTFSVSDNVSYLYKFKYNNIFNKL